MFSVYILIKDSKPVYIGQTNELRRRINEHKREEKKDFDSYIELMKYENKKHALIAEKAIYRFLFAFINNECLNKIEVDFLNLCLKNWLVMEDNEQVKGKLFSESL